MSKTPKSRSGNVIFRIFVINVCLLNCFVVSVWAAVDQGLSDRIATAIGHPPVKPFIAVPASEADKYRFVQLS